jgi:uncharacterized beta-barrel protein YwiB (DUF1934 family)
MEDLRKDMLLTFKSSVVAPFEESDNIEFITPAQFVKKNGKYYITFEDLKEYGNEATKSTLKVEDEKVTLLRYGGNNTQFIFEQGKKHTGHYETPFGGFSVGVFSDSLDVNLHDNGGNMDVSYGIYFEDMISHYNKLSINLRELGQ